ncbi:MAG: MerR family transcriptional regulator [Candidatus Gastranaerophilales bacterium]|nr:MerR family transcriptional regulator [Candidatus Gastranaerophilales bacterium]
MKRTLKVRYENASKTPNEPIFTTKDIMEIFKFSSQATAQRFDKSGLVCAKRNSIGHRVYSYNQIELMKKLQKLVEFDISHFTIKTLMEFEKAKGRDPIVYLEELAEFYTKRTYSANRNAARKKKKTK